MHTVYLSLGSNLGNREENLRAAIDWLEVCMDVTRLSSLYETEPVGVRGQPDFLNLALAGRTQLTPRDLLTCVKEIERRVGRRPSRRWGPRVVDVDILLFGDLVIETPDLVIPHAEMLSRAFVLVPLAEIAPGVEHPVLKVPIPELLRRAPGRDTVRHAGRLAPSTGTP